MLIDLDLIWLKIQVNLRYNIGIKHVDFFEKNFCSKQGYCDYLNRKLG